MTKAQQRIYDILISKQGSWKIEDIREVISLDKSVIHRHLQSLIQIGMAKKTKYGLYE